MDAAKPQYVLLDGDRVGRRIEDLLFREDLPRLYFLVRDLNEAVLLLARMLREVGGLVYACGGDTVLGSVGDVRPFLDRIHTVRSSLPCSFSAGVASSIGDALIAVKLAKARGPGQSIRVRRFRGSLLAAYWEHPQGWREESPARGSPPLERHRTAEEEPANDGSPKGEGTA